MRWAMRWHVGLSETPAAIRFPVSEPMLVEDDFLLVDAIKSPNKDQRLPETRCDAGKPIETITYCFNWLSEPSGDG